VVIIIIVVLVASSISFLCSLWEAALYAVPLSRIQGMVSENVRGAKLLLTLRERIEQPISAILTFNTIANTIGASIAGALVAQEYGPDSNAMYIFPPLFALLILIFSEIIPKTLGVAFADRIAPLSAYPIQGLIYILYPFVRMSQYVARRIRLAAQESEKTVSEADLIAQARIGVEEGSLLPEEALWVTNALKLNDKTAHELMTPRTVVYRLPAEMPLSLVQAHSEHWTHSRLPLCRDNDPDKVVGVVYRREVLDALLHRPEGERESIFLQDMMHPVEFVPETLRGNELLQRFLKGRQHLFIVTNEHGGMEGVITLEDVLEELVGAEIVDPHDLHPDMQEYARRLARRRTEGSGRGAAQ
jgi:CBS domain containing-hemolysin-like protein